jgi:hypothetical protein
MSHQNGTAKDRICAMLDEGVLVDDEPTPKVDALDTLFQTVRRGRRDRKMIRRILDAYGLDWPLAAGLDAEIADYTFRQASEIISHVRSA